VQTVDATVTDLFTWTIQPGQTIVDALVTAIKSDASQGANYKLKRRFRYGALGPVPGALVNLETDEDDATWDCTIDNNGTTGRVRVTGKAATTIQWFGVIQIVEVVP
jgi:molybdopterin/thiamine biosynthesis adenylyltransferase